MNSRAAKPESTPAPLRIGLVYEQPGDYPDAAGAPDRFAEFEPESTIVLMERAVRSAGHVPLRTGAPKSLFLTEEKPDVVWNIAEGIGTRNREAWAPVLCELHDIPFLGSDAYALSITLDKVRCKQVAAALGIPVTAHRLVKRSSTRFTTTGNTDAMSTGETGLEKAPESDRATDELTPEMPLFLKPRYGGTAMGIGVQSIVHNENEFIERAHALVNAYAQDVLAEPFLPGAEFTCAVAGYPLRALPVLERGLHNSGIGSHAVPGSAQASGERNDPFSGGHTSTAEPDQTILSHSLTPEREAAMAAWTLALCEELEIHDFARADFKCDAQGNLYFLEINPLPTFATDSTFAIVAELQGVPYEVFLGNLLSEALSRVHLLTPPGSPIPSTRTRQNAHDEPQSGTSAPH